MSADIDVSDWPEAKINEAISIASRLGYQIQVIEPNPTNNYRSLMIYTKDNLYGFWIDFEKQYPSKGTPTKLKIVREGWI